MQQNRQLAAGDCLAELDLTLAWRPRVTVPNVVPHIFDRGQLMLQYAIDISSLLGMYTVSSNNSSIQAPDVDTRNFMQRVLLTSGDTLVMTGFEQAVTNASSSGMGRSNNTMLGGGVSGKRNRSVLVILIQPITAE